jgi:hypothetical protein
VPAVTGSLAARILRMYDDQYKPVKVYPTLATGATVISANTNWGLGNFATIVPVSTIHSPFLLQIVTVETMDKDAVFELVFYSGAADTETARIRFSYNGGFYGNSVYRLPSALIAAESIVKAKLASSNGLAEIATCTISIAYREVT